MRIIYACLLLLLIACQPINQTSSTNEPNGDGNDQQNQTISPDEKQSEDVDLKKFLKPDKTTATFQGEGNEFASYTEKTFWLNDQYVGTIEDNGGITMMTVYKISDEKIDIIYREPVETDSNSPNFPDIADLQTMEPIETYLAKPIEAGATFGKWTIAATEETVETPYQSFDHVIVLEETGENYINRKYLAEGFGVIKTESIMDTDQGEKYTVTSTLETLTND